jgi:hypothetical protein
MVKESPIMKLFAAKGGKSPSRETAAEMDSRAPLSPIVVKSRNKGVPGNQSGHSNHVHPPSHGVKKHNQMPPSALSQKTQSAEYVENVTTFSPGTPEHKFAAPATPRSAGKKRFGWNTTRQDDSSAPGSLKSLPSQFSLSASALRVRPVHPPIRHVALTGSLVALATRQNVLATNSKSLVAVKGLGLVRAIPLVPLSSLWLPVICCGFGKLTF